MTDLARLVSTVVEVMGNTFPELKQHEENIKEIIAEEELSFGRTLIKVWSCSNLDVMVLVWMGWRNNCQLGQLISILHLVDQSLLLQICFGHELMLSRVCKIKKD